MRKSFQIKKMRRVVLSAIAICAVCALFIYGASRFSGQKPLTWLKAQSLFQGSNPMDETLSAAADGRGGQTLPGGGNGFAGGNSKSATNQISR